MDISDGIWTAEKDEAREICEDKARQGWRVFDLPFGISSKLEFFDAVRVRLPLDPPLYPDSENWDALNDSLWGGLYSLRSPGSIIVWRKFDLLKSNFNSEFEVILGIFSSIANMISNPKYGDGVSSHLIVFLVED